jgi:hypothetical protein
VLKGPLADALLAAAASAAGLDSEAESSSSEPQQCANKETAAASHTSTPQLLVKGKVAAGSSSALHTHLQAALITAQDTCTGSNSVAAEIGLEADKGKVDEGVISQQNTSSCSLVDSEPPLQLLLSTRATGSAASSASCERIIVEGAAEACDVDGEDAHQQRSCASSSQRAVNYALLSPAADRKASTFYQALPSELLARVPPAVSGSVRNSLEEMMEKSEEVKDAAEEVTPRQVSWVRHQQLEAVPCTSVCALVSCATAILSTFDMIG